MTTSEYDRTIAFLAEIFPRLATMPAPGKKLYHDTFKQAVGLRGGVVDNDYYDTAIATSVLADVIERAFADFIRE